MSSQLITSRTTQVSWVSGQTLLTLLDLAVVSRPRRAVTRWRSVGRVVLPILDLWLFIKAALADCFSTPLGRQRPDKERLPAKMQQWLLLPENRFRLAVLHLVEMRTAVNLQWARCSDGLSRSRHRRVGKAGRPWQVVSCRATAARCARTLMDVKLLVTVRCVRATLMS